MTDVGIRNKQSIARFRFLYPGNQRVNTIVPVTEGCTALLTPL